MCPDTLIVPPEPQWLQKGGELLRGGGLVAFPTETVYGLGANALDPKGVERIFIAKGRPSDNPLIVHVASVEDATSLVKEFPLAAQKLASAFWPGPLTLVLPKKDIIPTITSGGLDSVALRIPAHPIALQLLREAKTPIAAPSANLSGSPSPTSAQHVYSDLKGRVDLIIDGGSCPVGVESTVVSLMGEIPLILRPGAVTLEDIRRVVGTGEVDKGAFESLALEGVPLSPGMKYRHYAPQGEVVLVHGDSGAFSKFVNERQEEGIWGMVFTEDSDYLTIPFMTYGSVSDPKTQAEQLFSVLRSLDSVGANKIYVHAPTSTGLGLAVYNRLLRAASFKEVFLK